MVMKVDSVNSIYFKQNSAILNSHDKNAALKPQIKELTAVTPDYNIKIPAGYKQTGIYELANGLKMYSYKLTNGYKVNIVPMEDSPAVVKNYVNVGSMNETANIKGISHFLEHMAFNGTNGENGHVKLEVGDSFKKVEEMGGWANASTSYAVTDYVNSTPLLKEDDIEKQIKIIAAMTEDLKLSDEMIEKEKPAVCSEIDMILDEPQTIALDQTVRTLFGIKNPADEMIGGSVKHIKNLTRKDIVDYYNKYYTPDNMNLVITGDVKPEEVIQLVAKNFNSTKVSKGGKFEENLEPISHTVRKDFRNKNAVSSEIVLGFTGPKNKDTKEKIIHRLSKMYLKSYASGLYKELKQYNAYPYIGIEKISTNPNSPEFNYIAVSAADKNCEKILYSLFKVISELKKPTKEQLNELKGQVKKNRTEAYEYSDVVNEIVGSAILNNNLAGLTDYDKILDSITEDDVYNGIKKYFDLNKAAITVVHPENTNVSFKGRREPLNKNNISNTVLDNNYSLGFYNTKSDNISYNIQLRTHEPYNKKAGVIEVLNEIYRLGTVDTPEDEFKKLKEKNNINIGVSVSPLGISVYSDSVSNNRKLMYEKSAELLYNPAINEENLEYAKNRIRDYINRKRPSAYDLYANYEVHNNPYEFSDEEVLKGLEGITLDDVKECHKYLTDNSRGIITANIPQNNPGVKQEIVQAGSGLHRVHPNKVFVPNFYSPNTEPVVLTQESNSSQTDIMQVYKFKVDDTLKEMVLGNITNSILTNSSIGLFKVLREKEHLAYSVYSDIDRLGDCGEISCNILTTTDNKDTGVNSYDNLKKSIDGFNRQINELKMGAFTDDDIENAKLALKAQLLDNEGTDAKLQDLFSGLNSKYGINYINDLYNLIDSITREDIITFAEKIFKNPPVYSIVASKDTLDNNKDFLKKLEA